MARRCKSAFLNLYLLEFTGFKSIKMYFFNYQKIPLTLKEN